MSIERGGGRKIEVFDAVEMDSCLLGCWPGLRAWVVRKVRPAVGTEDGSGAGICSAFWTHNATDYSAPLLGPVIVQGRSHPVGRVFFCSPLRRGAVRQSLKGRLAAAGRPVRRRVVSGGCPFSGRAPRFAVSRGDDPKRCSHGLCGCDSEADERR